MFIKIFITICLVLFHGSIFAETSDWKNQCPDDQNLFCKDVGKTAYNVIGNKHLRNIPLGEIEGVIYRPAGSMIGHSPAIPDAGIEEVIRTAPEDGWYYIINQDEGSDPFLRWAREIAAR